MSMDYKYEVITIAAPLVDRDLTVRVNEHVKRVRAWNIRPQHVRVVSLCKAIRPHGHALEQYLLTIEYTAKESQPPHEHLFHPRHPHLAIHAGVFAVGDGPGHHRTRH